MTKAELVGKMAKDAQISKDAASKALNSFIDGQGFPNGLVGNDIPNALIILNSFAQIIGIKLSDDLEALNNLLGI